MGWPLPSPDLRLSLIPFPAPTSRAPPCLGRRVGLCAPSPPLLLIGAEVGESPPHAYVRVRAVPAHLAFELRRFWLQFTSHPAFSARCCARQGSSKKATGVGEGATAVDTGEKRTRESKSGKGEKEELPALSSKLPGHLSPLRYLGPSECRQPPRPATFSSPALPVPTRPPGACLGAKTGMIR